MASEEKTDKSSPTTSGPDSDVASVEELPKDKEAVGSEELTDKVSSGANYLGTFLSSAWSKTTKTANDATTSSSSFLTSAFGKVGGSTANSSTVNSAKSSPKAEDKPFVEPSNEEKNDENKADQANNVSASSYFNSAWTKMGDLTKSVSQNIVGPNKENDSTDLSNKEDEPPIEVDENQSEKSKDQVNFFSNFSTKVYKVANNASSAIKDKVSTTMIGEFNKEQEEFIKNKGPELENGLPPWVGYQDENAMKAKILSLSKDKRNFVRAPPSGVTFEFDYASVSAVALAILQEDPQLEKMRYELVPKQVKEDEFWRNYFYRVNLIKQSFDLKDLETSTSSRPSSITSKDADKEINNEEDVNNIPSQDHDDEFVSDSYQASSADIDEVNASMKKLGVKGKKNEEWEAELEGELNEFEMVSSKADEDSNDPEWENQIQEMLDAEENH